MDPLGPQPPPGPRLRLTGAADGPAPALWFVVFIALWTITGWLAASIELAYATPVLLAGFVVYWAMVPKADSKRPIPGWTIVPLLVAFVALLYLVGLLGKHDARFVPIGYGVWFVAWLQLGLWLRDISPRTRTMS